MIYSKDRVSRTTLIALLNYSMSPECQFLVSVKPPTQILNDHEVREGSIVTFLKIEEKVFLFDDKEKPEHRLAFAVKVCVEDRHLIIPPEGDEHAYRTEPVPPAVLNRISEILNSNS